MTIRAYIGVGSNLGDPVAQVKDAIEELEMLPDSVMHATSSLYSSKPMGPADQPDYINAVAGFKTVLEAEALLQQLHMIENVHGRKRNGVQWGARTLDLDILLYGQEMIDELALTIPHPGLYTRSFVLQPLFEIAPKLTLPSGDALSKWITTCPQDEVWVLEEALND